MSAKSYENHAGANHGYYRVWQYEVSDEERALIDELKRAGVNKIYSDRPHKTKPKKIQDREALTAGLKEGDYIVVPELHYLGDGTLQDLCEAIRQVMQAGAYVRVLRPLVDTGTPEGEVFVQHLEMISATERELREKKKQAGIVRTNAKKKTTKGRRASIAKQCGTVIRYRYYRDHAAIKDIAKECKITEQSVRKVLDPLRNKVEEIRSSQPQLIADSHTDDALLRLGEQLGMRDRHLLRHIRDYVLMQPKEATGAKPSESRQSM